MNEETSGFTVTPFRRLTGIHQISGQQPAQIADGRRIIRLQTGNIEVSVDQSEEALIGSGRGLYQRADRIVFVGEAKRIAADASEVTVRRIHERGEHALAEDLACAAQFEKWNGRSHAYVPTDPPSKLVNTLRERTGRFRFPVLEGIISAPTIRPDGSLLDMPGYDKTTGLLYEPGTTSFPKIAHAPSRQDAERALDLLKSLIATFPFVGEADRSVALSALMTATTRRAFPSAPMHANTAPTAGSGKSLLVDLAAIFATGRKAPVIAQGQSEEETEKRLGSILLTGDQIVAIDNCERPLGGETLNQMITQPTVRVRILGRSEAPELSTGAFVTATGNNLVLVGDMTRRALLCSLDPKVERPELRTFDSNPIADARAKRGAYVAAVLTILRGYIAAGRPKQADPLGSFEEWSGLVRNSLIWLGCADPVETMEATRDSDPQLDALRTVAAQWWKVLGSDRVSARAVIDKAVEKTSPNAFEGDQSSFVRPDFRDALLAVAGQGGAVNSRRLGQWLKAHADRVISVASEPADEWDRVDRQAEVRKLRFCQMGLIDGITTWRLDNMQPAQAPEF